MKKILSALFLVSGLAYAGCDQFVPYGFPTVRGQDTTQLCRIGYAVLHDNEKKVPVYAAEYLIPENLEKSKNERKDAFKADPDLHPSQRSELTDYDKTYDRGHMAPFEDMRANSAAGLQSFYLSNMVPQDLHLNRGIWRSLETKVRDYAKSRPNGVYVITGPIFDGRYKTIGNGVWVPSKVFKVVIDKESSAATGYIIPNEAPVKGMKLANYKVTLPAVSRATGINFVPSAKSKTFADLNIE